MKLAHTNSKSSPVRRIPVLLVAAGLGLLLASVAPAQPQLVEGWRADLTWERSRNPAFVLDASPEDRVRLVVTLTGADSLQGFVIQLRGRAVGESPRATWLFRDTLECPAAGYEITARRDRGARAPWANPLLIHDLQYGSLSGAAVFIVAGAFDLAVLDPDSTYVLFALDLIPPQGSEECSGWDSSAIFDIVSARVLHAIDKEIPIAVPGVKRALRIGKRP